MKKLLSAVAFCFAAFSASMANASVITWTLQGASFDDGGTASGWFSAESTNRAILGWDITTTAGSSLPGFHYDTGSSSLLGIDVFGGPYSFLLFRNTPFAQPYLNLAFLSDWTASGTISLNTVGFNAYECNNCSPLRAFVEGVAVSDVPEPASLALLGLGLAGLAAVRRRKQTA